MGSNPTLSATEPPSPGGSSFPGSVRRRWTLWLALWGLFFAIGGGLGYPILNRYDPTTTPGIIDVFSYGQIVSDGPGLSGRNSYRVLQPMLGKAVYLLVKDRSGPWRPVSLALLVSAAAFVATTLVLLVALGVRTTRDPSAWALAPLLYVCTFWVPNGMLAGLVDASEACLLALLAWALWTRHLWILPLAGVLGGLAKETFAPLSAAFAGGWWLAVRRAEGGRSRWREPAAIASMAALAVAMPTLVRLAVDGRPFWPWELGAQLRSPSTLAGALRAIVLDPGLYYPFVWLAPLAAMSWRAIPRPWLAAALASAGVSFCLGVYANAGGTNLGRPLFNVLGLPLSLAAATTLVALARRLGVRPGSREAAAGPPGRGPGAPR